MILCVIAFISIVKRSVPGEISNFDLFKNPVDLKNQGNRVQIIMAYKFIDNYREQGARKRLVEILEKKGIEDKKLLKAFGKVPRHFFFDETFWNQAYKDIAFPIGEGQTISQPYTVAYQTQLLH